MGKAAGEGGLEEAEQEGLNLNHEPSPVLQINLERRGSVNKSLKSNEIHFNHCHSSHELHFFC